MRHMVNINRQMMLEGMRADFHKVDRLSSKVIDIVRNAKDVRATTPAGSDFTATLNPNYRWLKTSGLISPDKWGNLPGGEVFTTPGDVNGTFVIDGVVGDYLCERYGSLEDDAADAARQGQPPRRGAQREQGARETISGATRTPTRTPIASASSRSAPTSSCKEVIGHILQDEKFPGMHIAFGNPYGAHTGADW